MLKNTATILVYLLFITISFSGLCQHTHQFHAEFITGTIAPHYSDMKILRQNAVLGGALQYNFIPDKSSSVFELHYKKPEYGAGIEVLSLGNPEMLGKAYSIYLHWGFHAVNKNRSKLKIWFAPGVAYVSKIYDPLTNPENTALSNHLNIYFKLASTYAYQIA